MKGGENVKVKIGVKSDDKWKYQTYVLQGVDGVHNLIYSLVKEGVQKITIERIT